MVVFAFLGVECDFLGIERNIYPLLAGIEKRWGCFGGNARDLWYSVV